LSTSEVKPPIKAHSTKEIKKLLAKEIELLQRKRQIQLRNILNFQANRTTTNETKITHVEATKVRTIYKADEIQNIIDELAQIYNELAKYDKEYVSLRRPKPILMKELKEMIR
jgi:hypothetical protein